MRTFLFICLLIIVFLFLNFLVYRKTYFFYHPVKNEESLSLQDDLLVNDLQTYLFQRLEKKKDLENKNTVKMFVAFILLILLIIFVYKIVQHYQRNIGV